MNTVNKLFRGFVFASIVLLNFSAHAADSDSAPTKIDTKNPYSLVKSVAEKTFARFNKDKQLIAKNPDHLKAIVTEELMPYVDYKYASYKVLGQYLRDTTKDERQRFVDAFRGYLISTYAQAFTQYTDQTVKFAPAKDFSNEKIVDVNVEVVETGRPSIKLQFKVRRLKDGSWKVFDLIAEGVSLLSSKRSEITNLVRQKGVEPVIKMLIEHSQAHVDTSAHEQTK